MLCSRTTNKESPLAQLHEKIKGHAYFWGLFVTQLQFNWCGFWWKPTGLLLILWK
jgi:hypothetical protein